MSVNFHPFDAFGPEWVTVEFVDSKPPDDSTHPLPKTRKRKHKNSSTVPISNDKPFSTFHKKLPADLTKLIDRYCKPFWNKSVKEWSAKLPSCTDFVDLEAKDWNDSLTRLTQNSWFSVNVKIQKDMAIPLPPSSPYLWQNILNAVVLKIEEEKEKTKKRKFENDVKRKAEEDTQETMEKRKKLEEEKVEKRKKREEQKQAVEAERLKLGKGRGGKALQPKIKSDQEKKKNGPRPKKPAINWSAERIRIYPNVEQRKLLHSWFGCARWTYNQAVDKFNKFGTPAKNLTFLRQTIVNDGLHKNAETKWVLDTPTEVRTEAVRDFIKAVDINLKKVKEDPEFKFEMKFRSIKTASQTIVISKKQGAKERALLTKMKSEKRELILDWKHDMKLTCKKDGSYYLCISKETQIQNENQVPNLTSLTDGVIALDPGVRTFVTGFDGNGNAFEWCKNDVERLCRLRYHYDKLNKKMKGVFHARRYRMRKALCRLQARISNLVDALHHSLTKWLCENYRIIFLPKFEIKNMVKKKGGRRKIAKKTVRSLYALRHYTFQQRLLSKSREYPWVKVFICNEAYTTKTCTNCGKLNNTIGGNKVFECNSCQKQFVRDISGARNILLRQLGALSEYLE